jgi:hypothetical protein
MFCFFLWSDYYLYMRLLYLLLGLILLIRKLTRFEWNFFVRSSFKLCWLKIFWLFVLSIGSKQHNFWTSMKFLFIFIDELELFGPFLRGAYFRLVLSERFSMFFKWKLLNMNAIGSTLLQMSHLLHEFIVLLIFLFDKSIDVIDCFLLSSLVMFSFSVFNLFVIMEL